MLNSVVFRIKAKAIVGLTIHGFVLTALTASAIDLLPYSLRQTWYIEDEGRPYWEIRVTCSDQKTYRYMIRDNESKPWCAKQDSELCYEDKLDLAFAVCKDSYAATVAASKQQTTQNSEDVAQQNRVREELLAREAQLDLRRENLQKRKLELQRKEQDLRSREIDLAERKSKLQ